MGKLLERARKNLKAYKRRQLEEQKERFRRFNPKRTEAEEEQAKQDETTRWLKNNL